MPSLKQDFKGIETIMVDHGCMIGSDPQIQRDREQELSWLRQSLENDNSPGWLVDMVVSQWSRRPSTIFYDNR